MTLISDLLKPGGLWHWLLFWSTQPWNSMFTEAVFAPMYSPVMFAAMHLTVGCPTVVRITSRLDPVKVSFSVADTGTQLYLPLTGAFALVRQVALVYSLPVGVSPLT